MNKLIWLLILIFVVWGVKSLYQQWENVKDPEAQEQSEASKASDTLPGLPPELESGLHAAKQGGAESLKAWLDRYGHLVQDPRLADIQLDYVILVSSRDPSEARKLFRQVKQRTPESSPVYPRIRQLSNTYE
jgi:hypothetical protein